MPPELRRYVPRTAVHRRATVWMTIQRQQFTGSLGFVTDQLSPWRTDAGVLQNPPGSTVIRSIVNFSYRGVAVDDNIARLMIGLIVAPIDDAPPSNSLSGSENDRDWLWWEQVNFVQERQQGTPTQNLLYQLKLDVRSARKLDAPGRTLFLVVEAQDSDTMDFSYSGRYLVKTG